MPFQPGHKLARGGARPGAGRKPDRLKAELQALLDACVPEQRWKGILEVISLRAHAGDIKCAAFLFDRKFGRPVQHLEIAGDDADEAPLDLSKLSAEELATLERLMHKAGAPLDGSDQGGEGEAQPI